MRELICDHTTAGPIEGLYVGSNDVVVLFQGNRAMWIRVGRDSDDDPCLDIVTRSWDFERLMLATSPKFLQVCGLCSEEEVKEMEDMRKAAYASKLEKAERAELTRLLRKYGATDTP